jgi:hypothetical protein
VNKSSQSSDAMQQLYIESHLLALEYLLIMWYKRSGQKHDCMNECCVNFLNDLYDEQTKIEY